MIFNDQFNYISRFKPNLMEIIIEKLMYEERIVFFNIYIWYIETTRASHNHSDDFHLSTRFSSVLYNNNKLNTYNKNII